MSLQFRRMSGSRLIGYWLVWHLTVSLAPPATGQDGGDAKPPATGGAGNTGATQPTVENKSKGNALRLSVVNAVVNHVKNAREATIKLEWELLPESDDLLRMARDVEDSAEIQPRRLEIANADLGEPARWAAKIRDPEDRKALAQALDVPDLAQFKKEEADTRFSRRWSMLWNAGGPGAAITSAEYLTGLLDHHHLSFLFDSRGIRFTLAVPDATVRGENPRLFDREIRWRIALYPIRRGAETFYRVAIKAVLGRPVLLHFPNLSETSATLKAGAAFKSSPGTIGVQRQIVEVAARVNLPNVPSDELEDVSSKLGGTEIEGILKFVGGTDLTNVVSRGLLSGTSRASIYYGGLIGQGNLQQLLGVNQLVVPDRSGNGGVGFLLGVAPEGGNSLFWGPSYQTSVFTLGIGGIARETRKRSGSDETRVSVQSGVTLAFDLSRLLGGKENVQTIRLANSVVGGRSSDAVARDYFAVRIRVEIPATEAATLRQSSFLLRRVARFGESGGADIPLSPPDVVVRVPVISPNITLFLKPGMYDARADDLPPGFKLLGATGQEITATDTFPVGRNAAVLNLRFQVRKR